MVVTNYCMFNWFKKKEAKTEQRAVSHQSFGLQSPLGSPVSVPTALSIPAVYAAVSNVADTISTLPLPVFQKDTQGGTKAYDHEVYALLNKSPNPVQTAKAFRSSMVVDLLCEGEFFAEIVRNGFGSVVELWRIPRSQVRTEWDRTGRTLRYFVDGTELPAVDLLHILNFSLDGIRGVSPFSLCKDSLSMTLTMEKFGLSFFKNAARPSGYLVTPPGLKPEDREDARQQWQQAYGGAENTGKTPALPNGFSWQKVSIDPEEGQYHESRIHQLRDCQRITRTPPPITNDFERQTWSNIEYSRMDYVQNTIRPLVVSIEQELNRKLISDPEHYIEHTLEGLLRGSFSEQIDSLTKAVAGPIYTANEARKILGLPATDGGDTLQGGTWKHDHSELKSRPRRTNWSGTPPSSTWKPASRKGTEPSPSESGLGRSVPSAPRT